MTLDGAPREPSRLASTNLEVRRWPPRDQEAVQRNRVEPLEVPVEPPRLGAGCFEWYRPKLIHQRQERMQVLGVPGPARLEELGELWVRWPVVAPPRLRHNGILELDDLASVLDTPVPNAATKPLGDRLQSR